MSEPNRTALVTGAAQGVGAAIAERLASEGVKTLILVDRDAAGLDEVKTRLGSRAEVVTVGVDLLDIGSAREVVARRLSPDASLDILVNAAGVTDRGGLDDITVTTFDRLFGINVRAPLFLTQLAAPALRRRGGVVINVCSMLAYGGPPFLLGYSASKAALVALTKSIANTLKRDRVRAFGINLGWTVTPNEHKTQMQLHGLPENWAEVLDAGQPLGRLLRADDVADLVAFLISDGAKMMTGAIVDLDQYVAGTVDDNPGSLNRRGDS